jgi:hypothetical protein
MMPNTVDMEETLVADMGGTLVMAAMAMEVTMAVEADMGGTLVMVATAMEVDMVAEGGATMDVVGGVTMEMAAVDAALMLVKLLMQKPKPSLKTKL